METSPPTAAELRAYLDLLGVEAEPPSLPALRRLVRAHLVRVPFETVSKLHYLHTLGLRDVPPLALFLDGIRGLGFGGTCYSSNLHLSRLLRALGYRARLCGADMPSGEDVHAAVVVTLGGHDWLVDAGYAALLLAPLALDATREQVVRSGLERWVLRPRDERGCSRLEHWHGDEHVHGYLLKPWEVAPERFDGAVSDSFRPDATFMNAVLAVRCFPRRTVTILNLTVVRADARRAKAERLADREALAAALVRELGMPADVVRGSLAQLGELGAVHG